MFIVREDSQEFVFSDSGISVTEPWRADPIPFDIHFPFTGETRWAQISIGKVESKIKGTGTSCVQLIVCTSVFVAQVRVALVPLFNVNRRIANVFRVLRTLKHARLRLLS